LIDQLRDDAAAAAVQHRLLQVLLLLLLRHCEPLLLLPLLALLQFVRQALCV
jgi:hypothetical protein